MPKLDKLIQWLRQQDEVTIMDLLDLKTEDIVERFKDVIEERKHLLDTEYEELPDSDEEIEDDDNGGLNVEEYGDYEMEIPPWEEQQN